MKWLAISVFAASAVWCMFAYTGLAGAYARLFGGFDIPNYEPIKNGSQEVLTTEQKKLMADINRFAVTDMQRRHVSPEKINHFLWQMHFFTPVKYSKVNCADPLAYKSAPEKIDDFMSMGSAMDDIVKKYDLSSRSISTMLTQIPHDNSIFRQGGLVNEGISESNIAGLYSYHLWQFIKSFAEKRTIEKRLDPSLKHFLENDIRMDTIGMNNDFFNPEGAICGDAVYIHMDGFSVNKNYTKKYFSKSYHSEFN